MPEMVVGMGELTLRNPPLIGGLRQGRTVGVREAPSGDGDLQHVGLVVQRVESTHGAG